MGDGGRDAVDGADAVEAPVDGVDAVIELVDVEKRFGDSVAVDHVDIAIGRGEFFSLLGPSGCGKTTSLRMIAGFEAPTSGEVRLDGKDVSKVPPYKRNVNTVFQHYALFPHMSIFDNVAYGLWLEAQGVRKSEINDRVEQALRDAYLWDEVKDKLRHSGLALSGGQQQRLCIARAIAVKPEVLLMDEPCAALDPIATLAIEELINELVKNYTIVIVTHNMQQAARVSQYTAFFTTDDSRTGQLVEFGHTTDIFTNPKDSRTEDYITGRFG